MKEGRKFYFILFRNYLSKLSLPDKVKTFYFNVSFWLLYYGMDLM